VLGIDGFSAPAALTTIGTVGALVVFALYALNLVYSLQRMRARKLAFWVPLATAVIAGIVTFAFLMFGVYQVPELLQRLAEPDAMQTILDSLATTPTS
jgi:amino acid transporter